jgi:hypothetical protein
MMTDFQHHAEHNTRKNARLLSTAVKQVSIRELEVLHTRKIATLDDGNLTLIWPIELADSVIQQTAAAR